MARWGAAAAAAACVLCLGVCAPVAPPEGLVVHVASPMDGRWLFPTQPALRLEAVLLHFGVTNEELRWKVIVSFDDREGITGLTVLQPISPSARCLDPNAVPPQWRSGCAEHDLTHAVPEWAMAPGQHFIDIRVHNDGSSGVAAETRVAYTVVSPPRVELFFPVHNNRFVCKGPLTMVFTYDTDYEPSADFLEMGAGFHGAAVAINGTRGAISDTGFLATPPLQHGTHQLRVALFDHSGAEILGSACGDIEITVSPPATAGALSSGDVDGEGCHMVWLNPTHGSGGGAAPVTKALIAAAAPYKSSRGGEETLARVGSPGGGAAELQGCQARRKEELCAAMVEDEDDVSGDLDTVQVGGIPILCLPLPLSYTPSLAPDTAVCLSLCVSWRQHQRLRTVTYRCLSLLTVTYRYLQEISMAKGGGNTASASISPSRHTLAAMSAVPSAPSPIGRWAGR